MIQSTQLISSHGGWDIGISIVPPSRLKTPMAYLIMVQLIAWFVLFSQLTAMVAAAGDCDFPSSEFSALQTFYNSLNGPYWVYNETTWPLAIQSSWNNPRYAHLAYTPSSAVNRQIKTSIAGSAQWNFTGEHNPCNESWAGIACTYLTHLGKTSCYVDTLALPSFNLSGQLPSELNSLTYLSVLRLDTNRIHGRIPYLSSLTRLTVLTMSDNRLSGELPMELLSLPAIDVFDVSINTLMGNLYLEEMSSSLKVLRLMYNDFWASLDRVFEGILPNNSLAIQEINVQDNRLHGTIPPELCYLHSLIVLDMGSNLLASSLPACLGELTNLNHLVMFSNALTGPIPPNITLNANLTLLDLTDNRLEDNLTTLITPQLSRLVVLGLAVNQISGSIPPAVRHMKSISLFDIGYNHLSGSIPDELYGLWTLVHVDLSVNAITGRLQSNISSLLFLESLSLSDCMLTGTIPAEIGHCSQLITLYLDRNHFHGPIPASIGNITGLSQLYLSNNRLTGSLPSTLFNLTRLFEIDLSYNPLHTLLPASLANWQRVAVLSMIDIGLYGSLDGFCDIPNLSEISLGNNYLTGTIPGCLSVYFNIIDLSGNYLTGGLPANMANMTALSELQLCQNQLTGDLSQWRFQSPKLYVLMLQQNHFIGSIETLLGSLLLSETFNYLDISFNYFTGTLPETLGRFEGIQQLDLGSNCFHGSLPAALCELTALRSLALDGLSSSCSTPDEGITALLFHSSFTRYIDGGFPGCLLEMANLTTLKASGNGLAGPLPDITVSSNLTYLTLSNNRLSSTIPRSLQIHRWDWLDLSYNHLNGTLNGFSENLFFSGYPSPNSSSYVSAALTSSTAANNSTVYLQGNRLSGTFPSVLLGVRNIDVLIENLFSCDSVLPANDPYFDAYSCGSSTLFNSFYPFVSVTVTALVTIAVALALYRLSYSVTVTELLDRLSRWRQECDGLITATAKRATDLSGADRQHASELGLYVMMLRWFRKLSWMLASLIIAICSVSYPLLKIPYHTVTYQYGWLLSSAFMTGNTSAGVLLMLLCLFTVIAIRATIIQHRVYRLRSTDTSSEATRFQSHSPSHYVTRSVWRRIGHFMPSRKDALLAVAVLFNILVVSIANIIYAMVYIESTSPQLLSTARIILPLFQFTWSVMVVPLTLNYIDGECRYRPVKFCVIISMIYFFNAVIVPCLVSMIILSACFKNIFIGFEAISSTYTWTVFNGIDVVVWTYQYTSTATETISFQPPFVYSGQCSSGIIVAYIPVFMLMYLFQMVVTPVVYTVLCYLPHESMPRFTHSVLPCIIWPHLTSFPRGFPVKTSTTVASIIVDFGVLLTFGCMSPPLALVVCVCITSKTLTKELLLGRYVAMCRDYEEKYGRSVSLRIEENVSVRVSKALSLYNRHLSLDVIRQPSAAIEDPQQLSKYSHFSLTSDGGTNRNTDRETSVDSVTLERYHGQIENSPLELLESSCKGVWNCPYRCLSLISAMCFPLYVLVCFDISGIKVASLGWIIGVSVGVAVLLYVTRHVDQSVILSFLTEIKGLVAELPIEPQQQPHVSDKPVEDEIEIETSDVEKREDKKVGETELYMNSSFSETKESVHSPLQYLASSDVESSEVIHV